MHNSILEKLYKYYNLGCLTDQGFDIAQTILKIFDRYPLSRRRIQLLCDEYFYGWSVEITINLPNIALIIEISNTIDIGIYDFSSTSVRYPANLQSLTFNQKNIVYEYLISVLDNPTSYLVIWLDD